MDKFEYKSIKFETKGFTGGDLDTEKFDSELNKMGETGWCLVSCFNTTHSQGASRLVVSVFKRAISS